MALRLGIISTARINELVLRGAERTDRVEVAAACSPRASSRAPIQT
jgi:hypothetical protein